MQTSLGRAQVSFDFTLAHTFADSNFMCQCVTMSGKVANYKTDIVVDSGSGITAMSLDLFNLIN